MDSGTAVKQGSARDDRHEAELAQEPPAPERRTLTSTILGFLRLSSDDKRPSLQDLADHEGDEHEPEQTAGRNALEGDRPEGMPWLYRSVSKPRRRTGSLRKTAILGTGRARERRDTLTQLHPDSIGNGGDSPGDGVTPRSSDELDPNFSDAKLLELERRRRISSDADTSLSSPTGGWPAQDAVSSLPALVQSPSARSAASTNASTTDDDESLSFGGPAKQPVAGANGAAASKPPAPPSSASGGSSPYFPSLPGESFINGLVRRRSSNVPGPKALSPLSALPMDYAAAAAAAAASGGLVELDVEHSYDETEWWGWVLLSVTWLVFVIGMGSCLDIWSWAWDVGQTPYAPPELEDDPTLPIIGYYPVLIILTAVMAWVWVVVAWVGMKYFKHAKIQGDDV